MEKCTVIITYLNVDAQTPLNRLVVYYVIQPIARHMVTSRSDGA